MIPQPPESANETDAAESDLWFLPGPIEDAPEPTESSILTEWAQSEASLAARLATVAGRLGALEDRLSRGPEGWRHRLALIEAAELSWFAGDRIGPDRLALWAALRLSGVQDDAGALARVGWALRRLSGGPGPEPALAEFLGRHDTPSDDPLTDRADSWLAMMQAARALHPISRACLGFHLWSLAGLSRTGDRLEAAVTAARIAGAGFAPLAMGGAGGLRAGGTPDARLAKWLTGMEDSLRTAMRTLDTVEAWDTRARAVMAPLSGRTPPALRKAFVDWPLLSAPMAETLTGASRAAVQRNLTWMQAQGLIREVTGQGRFRMWKAV